MDPSIHGWNVTKLKTSCGMAAFEAPFRLTIIVAGNATAKLKRCVAAFGVFGEQCPVALHARPALVRLC